MSVQDRERFVVDSVPKGLLIGGGWRAAAAGGTFDVSDPSTGDVLCAIADATSADGFTALDAAEEAQVSWAQHPPRERGEILRRAYELIMSRLDDLALLMTLEMGKPPPAARAEG